MAEYNAGDIVELSDDVFVSEEAFWANEPIAKTGDKVLIRKVCDSGAGRWYRCSTIRMSRSFRVEPREIARKVEPDHV